jgi:hypothetical protein
MGLLACVLRPSGLTHGSPPPCSSLSSSGDLVPMVPNLVSSPSSAWQAIFSLDYLHLPILLKLSITLFDLEQLVKCYLALIDC